VRYFQSKLYLACAGKFNIVIIDNLCIELGKAKLTTDGDEEHKYRMRLLSTKIVNWKINNRIIDHPLVRILSETVDELVLRMGPLDLSVSQQLRQQYAKNLCDAVKGLGPVWFKTVVSFPAEEYDAVNSDCTLSIAQAAIGGTQILDCADTTLQDVLHKKVFFLPSFLETAVAANQANVVERSLEFLMARFGKQSAQAIGKAIGVAVQTPRNAIGFLVFDFLKKYYDILGKDARTCWGLIRNECMKYGNTDLFGTIMWWKRADEVPDRSITDLRIALTEDDIWYILQYASSNFIRYLITDNWLDPGNVEGETLLWIALSDHNWKAAKKIIDAGVDINQVLPSRFSVATAYQRACYEGNPQMQYYLIQWGADTRPLERHGQPWTSEENEAKLWIHTNSGKRMRYEYYVPGYEVGRGYPPGSYSIPGFGWVDPDDTDEGSDDD
jgi:hypothetical protein